MQNPNGARDARLVLAEPREHRLEEAVESLGESLTAPPIHRLAVSRFTGVPPGPARPAAIRSQAHRAVCSPGWRAGQSQSLTTEGTS